ncbi:hypothetical protein SeGA_4283, partial [Salmonella enterica subsp. enterica serovar Gaminara str. A4-567]
MISCISPLSSRFSLRRIAMTHYPTRNFCAARTG